jgi:hypothetical protein
MKSRQLIFAHFTSFFNCPHRVASTAFGMYNIAFAGLITILIIISLVELDQISRIVVQTVSVLWGSCFCSLAFVLPRLVQVQKDHQLVKLMTSKSFSATSSFRGNTFSFGDGCTFHGISGLNLSSFVVPRSRMDSMRCVSNSDLKPERRETTNDFSVDGTFSLLMVDENEEKVKDLDTDSMNHSPDVNKVDSIVDNNLRIVVATTNYRQRMGTALESAQLSGSSYDPLGHSQVNTGNQGNYPKEYSVSDIA